MNYEVRLTKTYATCGGRWSDCETYKNHPLWDKMKSMNKIVCIPPGELALFISVRDEKFCLCKHHALEFIDKVKKEIFDAEAKIKNEVE